MFPRSVFLLLLGFLIAVPAAADPPGRVGRISHVTGSVTLHGSDGAEAANAMANWPVTSGETVSTDRGARVEIRMGSTALRLDGDSELQVTTLDDSAFRVRLIRGNLALRLRNPEVAREFELSTEHGRVLPLEPGRYRVDHVNYTTSVTAYEGRLRFDGEGTSLTVQGGNRAEIWYSGSLGYLVAPLQLDDFHDWNLARDRREDASRAAQYVSPEMTGYEELDRYGDWNETAEYGTVWYPRALPTGWAPYRSGHWAWIDPWGWTWIDDAPWGFAPFHYGRWVLVRSHWAWVPGRRVARPVYAPALVVWIGRPGWSASIGAGATPTVGWFPLAPREAFHPAYRCSTAYVQNVNITHVSHVTHVHPDDRTRKQLRHVHRERPEAVTVVPAEAVSRGRPVSPLAVALKDARILAGVPVTAAPVDTPPPVRRHRGDQGTRSAPPPAANPAVGTVATPIPPLPFSPPGGSPRPSSVTAPAQPAPGAAVSPASPPGSAPAQLAPAPATIDPGRRPSPPDARAPVAAPATNAVPPQPAARIPPALPVAPAAVAAPASPAAAAPPAAPAAPAMASPPMAPIAAPMPPRKEPQPAPQVIPPSAVNAAPAPARTDILAPRPPAAVIAAPPPASTPMTRRETENAPPLREQTPATPRGAPLERTMRQAEPRVALPESAAGNRPAPAQPMTAPPPSRTVEPRPVLQPPRNDMALPRPSPESRPPTPPMQERRHEAEHRPPQMKQAPAPPPQMAAPRADERKAHGEQQRSKAGMAGQGDRSGQGGPGR